jgi:hypothetical protein
MLSMMNKFIKALIPYKKISKLTHFFHPNINSAGNIPTVAYMEIHPVIPVKAKITNPSTPNPLIKIANLAEHSEIFQAVNRATIDYFQCFHYLIKRINFPS